MSDPLISGRTDVQNTLGKTIAVRYRYSRGFPEILQQLNCALAISTYQGGRVAVAGVSQDRLEFSFHNVVHAMGIAVGNEAMALGSRRQIHLLGAAHGAAAGIKPEGQFDAAWLIRHSFHTGNICSHELAWGQGGLWVVNTRFSTLCTLDEQYSFVPRWRPRFVTTLDAGDRCHLNGLAMHNGRPKYVTCHGETETPEGWRDGKATGGCVVDVDSGETIVRGLAMPHSPRLIRGRLWVLNSGAGQLGFVDPASGRYEPVQSLPGYTRGFACCEQFAFVGLSRIRETSIFGGLPLEPDRTKLISGVAVVDLTTAATVATLEFPSGVNEVFAVAALPNCQRPCISGPQDTTPERTDIWVVPGALSATSGVAGETRQTLPPVLPDSSFSAHPGSNDPT